MSLKKNDITLAAKHQNIMEQFKNQENERIKMEDEINQLTLDLNNIDKETSIDFLLQEQLFHSQIY